MAATAVSALWFEPFQMVCGSDHLLVGVYARTASYIIVFSTLVQTLDLNVCSQAKTSSGTPVKRKDRRILNKSCY